jgi:hypothetical protein
MVIVLGLVIYLVDLLPLPPPFKLVARIIIVIIAILYLLQAIGMGPGVRLGV